MHPKTKELLQFINTEASHVSVENNVPIMRYINSGNFLASTARDYLADDNLVASYYLLSKLLTLFVEKIRFHSEYRGISAAQKTALKKLIDNNFELVRRVRDRLVAILDKEFENEEIREAASAECGDAGFARGEDESENAAAKAVENVAGFAATVGGLDTRGEDNINSVKNVAASYTSEAVFTHGDNFCGDFRKDNKSDYITKNIKSDITTDDIPAFNIYGGKISYEKNEENYSKNKDSKNYSINIENAGEFSKITKERGSLDKDINKNIADKRSCDDLGEYSDQKSFRGINKNEEFRVFSESPKIYSKNRNDAIEKIETTSSAINDFSTKSNLNQKIVPALIPIFDRSTKPSNHKSSNSDSISNISSKNSSDPNDLIYSLEKQNFSQSNDNISESGSTSDSSSKNKQNSNIKGKSSKIQNVCYSYYSADRNVVSGLALSNPPKIKPRSNEPTVLLENKNISKSYSVCENSSSISNYPPKNFHEPKSQKSFDSYNYSKVDYVSSNVPLKKLPGDNDSGKLLENQNFGFYDNSNANSGLISNFPPKISFQKSISTNTDNFEKINFKQNDSNSSELKIDRSTKPPPIHSTANICMKKFKPFFDRKQKGSIGLAVKSMIADLSNSLTIIDFPKCIHEVFLSISSQNNKNNFETCGIIAGVKSNGLYYITHLIIPQQRGGTDSCECLNEFDIISYQDANNLVTLGWIHTHPSQTCFLSSVDLHTQYGYQCLLSESIAVVVSVKYQEMAIYSLTSKGTSVIQSCSKTGFHTHDSDDLLFEEAKHVTITDRQIQIADLR